jgi:trimethylamine--corrinoid protein Co-methyltransferase
MNSTSVIKPDLRVMNPEQIAWVHKRSLQILSTVGLRVDSPRARQLLARASSPADVDGERVRIPEELVAWALDVAPRSVEVYDRHGNLAFRLPGEARFGIGVTALYYQDPLTDEVTPFRRDHMKSMVRLGSALPSFDVISTPGIIQDVPPAVSDLYATLDMTANTSKPLVILSSDEGVHPQVLDLLEHLHGNLSGRPSIIPYLNPITPLVVNRGTVDKMWVTIERGLPLVYSNYGMAGASTPITPAGVLVLLNAELLAGLVVGQLIREGTPMILGCLPAYFDMRGLGSFYGAQSYVVDLACAEMMAHYGLPHSGTSGSGSGWGADLIAAGHQWFNHLISCMGQAGLVPFVGDCLGSMAFSPAIPVLANEVIAQARDFAAGFALEDSTVDLDEISGVGPGGNFLMAESTLSRFREATYYSEFLPPMHLEEWRAKGCTRADAALREHTHGLLERLPEPEDHERIMAEGEAFLATLAPGEG